MRKYAFIGLTLHHFEFIRKADVVFIFNKDGYIGNSTTLELGVACGLGKPVYALEHDKDEESRDVLFDKVIKTYEELVDLLKKILIFVKEKVYHQKLIRDKIPQVIEASGGEYETRVLSDGEFQKELMKKLVEEAEELADSDKENVLN